MISLTISSPDSSPISQALSNTDPDIKEKILSIKILPDEEFHQFCTNPLAVGCTKLWWDNSEKLKFTKIYISDDSPYLENTIYHELGHVKFSLNNKFNPDDSERFANNYANKYSSIII